MTAGDLARRAGSIERTGARAVAESLSAVAALARVPVIDDHLRRHLASPNASGALLLVGSCRQSPVTAFAVDRKRRWNTTPRWRRCLFRNLTYSIFQIADLVELNGLQTRIGNRKCFAGDGITHLELVFGVRAFPHANEKFSDLTPNVAAHPERVTQIGVTALIERTAQSNPRLHASQHTVPGYFSTAFLLRKVKPHVFPNCIRDGVHPGSPWPQLGDQSECGVRTVWPAAGRTVSRGCLVRDSHVAGPDCSV